MRTLPRVFRISRRWRLLLGLVLAAGFSPAYATPPGAFVEYTSDTPSVSGILPLNRSCTVRVTCPMILQGTTPITVSLRAFANQPPVGDAATAASYVSFSRPTLTFTQGGEVQDVVVTFSIPTGVLTPGMVAATFPYTIYTDGWPSPVNDPGAALSALVQFGAGVAGNPPAVAINHPGNYASFIYEGGTFPHAVDFDFTAMTDPSSPPITRIEARFGKPSQMESVTVVTRGLGAEPTVTGSGSISFAHPGKYELTVAATNAVGTALAEHTLTVVVSSPPPRVQIVSPAQHPVASYRYRLGDPALQVPFSIAASTQEAAIVSLEAMVDGVPLRFTADGLNTSAASATVYLTYSSASAQGTHTLWVTATDEYGLATTETGSFTIDCALPARAISGRVFFDLDRNGAMAGFDFGIGGAGVELRDAAGHVVATTTTGADGAYTFPALLPGNYAIVAAAFQGLVATTSTVIPVTLNGGDVVAASIGFAVDFSRLTSTSGEAHRAGYWKHNLDEVLARKRPDHPHGPASGVHKLAAPLSPATLLAYTSAISQFGLPPFDGLDAEAASEILGSKSSAPADRLAKELLAAEYNYQHGAYFNGSAPVTYAALCWGEAVLSNAGELSRQAVVAVTAYFAAYNASSGQSAHGPGRVAITRNWKATGTDGGLRGSRRRV